VWDAGVRSDSLAIDAAVAIARRSDVAVIVAGLEEGEFRDRASLGLPGRQEELIRAVAATGKPTIVVLVGGSAVTMPWLENVQAVVGAWYPGEGGGAAVANVLFGDYNPAGRLPITFPMAEGQLPLRYNHKPTGRGDDYLDLTGQPLFPFGFGLSYTTFEYSGLVVDPDTLGPSGGATVRFTVQNTGRRAGDEVAQLLGPLERGAHVRVELEAVEVRQVPVEGAIPEEPELAVHLSGLQGAEGVLPVGVDLLDPEVAREVRAQLAVAKPRLEVDAEALIERLIEDQPGRVQLGVVPRPLHERLVVPEVEASAELEPLG
jgi:hypothetical protein